MTARLGRWLAICVQAAVGLALFLTVAVSAATPETFIRADGRYLVDGNGGRFAIKGINLGNWLVPEGYMFKFTRARAPSEIDAVIRALIGPQDAARFLDGVPRRLCRQARHRLHQSGRIQHRACAAALGAFRQAGRKWGRCF